MAVPPESIENLIASTLKEVLTDWCINFVSDDDSSRANNVVLGKPTRELRNSIVVSVYMYHPLGFSKGGHYVAEGTPRAQRERPYKYPFETWGGMNTEEIIGAVQVNYREKEPYEDAIGIVAPIIGRIKKAINTDDRLEYLEDDMGWSMSSITTFETQGVASGGKNITVDRRWISWRAFIHSSNCRVSVS